MGQAGVISVVVHYALREGSIELRELPAPPELVEDEALLSPQRRRGIYSRPGLAESR